MVTVALTGAGLALVAVAHSMLAGGIDTTAAQRADQVIAALVAGDDDRLTQTLRPTAGERTIVQVLDSTGRIIAASAELAGEPPISQQRPAAGQTLRERRRLPIAYRGGRFRVIAVGTSTPQGGYVILVGQSLTPASESTDIVTGILLMGLPLLTLIIGAATFLFVGRALRPVEAMRRQAITITASNLHARLPVPTAQDEVAALATTMNAMLGRIEAASNAQRRFVADASHELRSPLTTIHAGLDLLAGSPLPAPAAAQVTRMRAESARMAGLIEDLLLLARFDEHGSSPRPDDVDLDDLAGAERDRIAALHPNLAIEPRIGVARVHGDPRHLQRAIRNLTDNAARHARSKVTINLYTTATQAHLVIGNDGPPIAPADRERIFERFVRLDDSRSRAGGGTGLGLPIARDIINAHGGTLAVDGPLDGAGASFHVTLPSPNPDPADSTRQDGPRQKGNSANQQPPAQYIGGPVHHQGDPARPHEPGPAHGDHHHRDPRPVPGAPAGSDHDQHNGGQG